MASPLAKRLFAIEGVTGVFYGSDFVTVTKAEDQVWSMLKPEIFAAIMEHFTSGVCSFRPLTPGSSSFLLCSSCLGHGISLHAPCGSSHTIHWDVCLESSRALHRARLSLGRLARSTNPRMQAHTYQEQPHCPSGVFVCIV